MKHYRQLKGFTLLEMLMVLAIMGSILLLIGNYAQQKTAQSQIDRTAMQMQEIANAALAYYVNKGSWPLPTGGTCGGGWYALDTTNPLMNTSPAYLPPMNINPFGQSYWNSAVAYALECDTNNNLTVATTVSTSQTPATNAITGAISVQLPLGLGPNPSCNPNCSNWVQETISPPGQNLNNARSVNFAGIYHSSECVPAPTCPPNMQPAIYVVPASANGAYFDANNQPTCTNPSAGPLDPTTCSGITLYPMSGVTAFARGGSTTAGSPPVYPWQVLDCSVTQASYPFACGNGNPAPGNYGNVLPAIESSNGALNGSTKYWRVCLSIVTEKGLVYPANSTSAAAYDAGMLMGTVLAITRCVPSNGDIPSGSAFNVFIPNNFLQP